jgi:hypothetical protein
MKTPQQHNLFQVDSISDFADVCKRAGASTSTVICSSEKVVIYYKDPLTNGIMDAEFVDEIHIQHRKSARILIAVFPEDDM